MTTRPDSDARNRLERFYSVYNPDKLSSVDATVAKYAGRHDVLFQMLERKYGPELTEDDKDDGETLVLSMGSGDCGQLGHGTSFLEVGIPKVIHSLRSIGKVIQCAVGGMHNIILLETGELLSWGCNDDGALGREGNENVPLPIEWNGGDIATVTAGDSHTLAMTKEGKVFGWGSYRDDSGIIGFAHQVATVRVPTLYPGVELATKNSPVVQIASGGNHSLAVSRNGDVIAWGSGQQGQLGRRVPSRKRSLALRPHPVVLPSQVERVGKSKRRKRSVVRCVSAGGYHSFAILESSEVVAWGLNQYGQLGLGFKSQDFVTTPTTVPELQNVVQVSAGTHFSIARHKDGTLSSFGRTDSHQLGIECDKTTECISTPTQIPQLSNINKISCGDCHVVASDSGSKLYTWGYGEMLQLGNGNEKDESKPFLVNVSDALKRTTPKVTKMYNNVTSIGAGGQHTVLILSV